MSISQRLAARVLMAALACTPAMPLRAAEASKPVASDAVVRIGTPVSMHLDAARVGAANTPADATATETLGAMTVNGTISLGAYEYSGQREQRLGGISGLAWSADRNTLYAVSDSGTLWRWRPVLEAGQLRAVDVLGVSSLRQRSGKPLSGARKDAEGLDVLNASNGNPYDDELVISFEQVPRIMVFTVDGVRQRRIRIPPRFKRPRTYSDGNHALEAVTVLPGSTSADVRLLSAPESPLRGVYSPRIPLFTNIGDLWMYRLGPGTNNGIVAMEALPDGSVVIVERSYGALPPRLGLRLRYMAHLPASRGAQAEVRTLAEASTLDGQRIDNFEGLARHQGHRFFLASDDNQNFLQRTLLSYIELDL